MLLDFREFKKSPDRLSDLLPWAALVADGVLLNKDGSFQVTFQYRGPDLDSSTESELVSISARANNALKRLGSGWCLFADAKREGSKEYPESDFPDPLSFLIDRERKAQFEDERHFESTYFLTLIYLPEVDRRNEVARLFIESGGESIDYEELLESFLEEVKRVEGLLNGALPEIRKLGSNEVLTYLHGAVSEKNHKVVAPEIPFYLDALLSDTPLITGFEPSLGSKHFTAISVTGFPGNTMPGVLDALNRLTFSYRYITRFIFLGTAEAQKALSTYKRKWFAKRKGIGTLLKETVTGSESVMGDSSAVEKAEDADLALQSLSDGAVAYGYFSATVVVKDKDRERLKAKRAEIERVINALGFVTKKEDINAVDAWLGTIPGNTRNNVRRPILHTLNLAHLMPVSAVWAGPKEDRHLCAPPLFQALTGESTAFRYSLFSGDVGHTLILGPTGSGKSVLLNFMEAQFLRYKDAQVYVFDKGGSAKVLAAGLGGEFLNPGGEGAPLTFQPLSEIDNLGERRFAHEWLLDILIQENVEVTPKVKEELWTALGSLASAPKNERTLYGLTVLLQVDELRSAILPYTLSGPHGALLDAEADTLMDARFQVFEMEALMETPSAVMPVLSYLFHRLERRFSGAPTLLVLDEAWLFLASPQFAKKIKEWLKVLRKKNVAVIFATQSLADIDGSTLAPVLKEACLTKVYLPNAQALSEDGAAFYKRFGLNSKQIRILAESTPKRHYFATSPAGNRLFELGLGEVALAFCAATSKKEQIEAEELLSHFKNTDAFIEQYLKLRGANWAADAMGSLREEAA